VTRIISQIKPRLNKVKESAISLVNRYPLRSFFGLLAILFTLIILSNIFNRPKSESAATPPPKPVTVYTIGQAPRLTLSAQIEKTGNIQITAFSSGVVKAIKVKEGSVVKKGQTLLSLASNYQGANALSLSRLIVQKQNQNLNDTYGLQKDLIAKQRELANQNQLNFEKLRTITQESAKDTRGLVNQNNDIIASLDAIITNLSVDPVTNASLILSTKQIKSQVQSGNLQLSNALKSAEYQSDPNNPPATLANLQKDMTLRQLELQEKALDLNKEISGLQLKLAQINESLMFPAAPFAGTIQHVYVRPGQMVAPGTPLFTLSGANSSLVAKIYTTKDIATKVSQLENTQFTFAGQTLEAKPSFISTEAVVGSLYSLVYNLPPKEGLNLTDKEYVSASVPIGYPDSSATMPYIPLDSVYQSAGGATIFVVKDNQAVSQTVTLGDVYGSFVRATSGVNLGDQIITNRNITAGDIVSLPAHD
jgi:multidrug efflux pump subunit AcrA (membrane-fusion protein)